MLDKLGINPLNLAAQIVNFAILFYILKRFLYKPILKILDERAKKISQGLKAAEETVQEREKIENLKSQEMKKTKAEVEKILQAARLEAENTSQKLKEKAQQEAKKQAEKEFLQMQRRLQKEEKAIKERVGKMVVEAARKVLQQSLDKTVQKQVFDAQLKKMRKLKKR